MNTLHDNKHLIDGAYDAIKRFAHNEGETISAQHGESKRFNNNRIEALQKRLKKYEQGYTLLDL